MGIYDHIDNIHQSIDIYRYGPAPPALIEKVSNYLVDRDNRDTFE